MSMNGNRRHLQLFTRFFISPERARTPVKALSGGERNRILLAETTT